MQQSPSSRGSGSVSWFAVFFGLILGLGGGLYYVRVLNPPVLTNIQPAQVNAEGKRNYLVVIALAWARDGKVELAGQRLAQVGITDWQQVADTACDLAKEGAVRNNTGLLVIRSLIALAETQGKRGCASDLVLIRTNTPTPVPTFLSPTPTRPPPLTKTPTPTLGVTFTPEISELGITPTPAGAFTVNISAFCSDVGTVEVFVQTSDGKGIPSMAIQVETEDERNRQIFFTGLKPERDLGYADYTTTPDERYIVSLRAFRETRTRPLAAGPCSRNSPQRASYRIIFRATQAEPTPAP